MNRKRTGSWTMGVGVAAVGLLVAGAPAQAKGKSAACTPAYATYKEGLARMKAGHLGEARDQFQSCAEETACAGLVPKCRAAAEKVTRQMPTIVPIVTDADGNAVLDVDVQMDGRALTSHLDGRGLPVDAGPHELAFARAGHVFATRRVIVVDGERNREVAVSTQPTNPSPAPAPAPAAEPAPAAPAPKESVAESHEDRAAPAETATAAPAARREETWAMPSSPVPYLVGTLGLAAVAGGTLLTVWGNKDNDAAVAQCHGACPVSTADHIRTLYTLADVSFGVGVAGLAVATWMFARSRSVEEAPVPAKGSATLDVAPTRTGVFASVKGTF